MNGLDKIKNLKIIKESRFMPSKNITISMSRTTLLVLITFQIILGVLFFSLGFLISLSAQEMQKKSIEPKKPSYKKLYIPTPKQDKSIVQSMSDYNREYHYRPNK